MKKLFKTCFILLLAAALLAGCKGVQSGKGLLRVGVRNDIMNFGYQNETTGRYFGFEIDLAKEAAERLGYDGVEYITVTPENRKEMLLSGEADCLIACYSIAETRLENFDFSPAYYHDEIRVMVEKSTLIQDMDELLQKKIGVLRGSNAGPLFAIRMNALGLVPVDPDFSVDTYTEGFRYYQSDSYRELDRLLETGEVDAVCMDGCMARAYMNEDRVLLEETIGEVSYGVATQKGSALSAPMAEVIQEMLDDGTIEALNEKWN